MVFQHRRMMLMVFAGAVAVALVGAAIFFILRSDSGTAPDGALPRAPEFSLYGANGAQVVLSHTAGHVRVLNFWASWSPYSRGELQMLGMLREEYGDAVVILAIGRDTDIGEGKRYVRELGLGTAPWILFDPDDTYYLSVGGYNMPETVVLDADGGIVYHVHGPVEEPALRNAIDTARSD